MDVSKFNLFGVLFNFKDKKARDDHAALAETVGVHGEDIQGLQAPTFSEPAANANVREAVAKVKSGATLGTLFTNVKAALNGLITLGEMRNYLVNNGTVTETGKYFLDAAYGKTLLDQITALNSKIIFIRISDTIVNGFIVYRDSRITDNHRAVATLSYIGPSSLLSVVLTTQTQKGSMNIYMRNFDNSIPEDGTNVQIDVLLYSSILFKGIINPKSNISCDDIYFSSEARGFYVFMVCHY